MKFGARIIKTGIAVTITMFICKVLTLEPAFFGAVSAIINIQPSIFLTLKTARNQIMVHIIGVVVGMLLGYLLGGTPIAMGLITIVIITLYIKLNLESGITMGIVAALFVISGSSDQFITHALARTSVIFVGLGTAMVINILLWPPRYGKQFKKLMLVSNQAAAAYFCQAVTSFVQLENQAPAIDYSKKDIVHGQNKELRLLYELLKREEKVGAANLDEQNQWLDFVEKLIDYNESITKKADRIYDLLPLRLDRRIQSGALPISEEFKAILEILNSGCKSISRLNAKLRSVIIEKEFAQPEEINENYWDDLTKAVEAWQPLLTGSYYLHGLMEAIVTANEIKWASREAKKLLAESTAKLTCGQQSS
ncbi:MAG: Aromatic acid exporter family er 1 [Firmicutes bacterium]|nr:Aromatic acid exporter family er 1 [Bacillota bacterium]